MGRYQDPAWLNGNRRAMEVVIGSMLFGVETILNLPRFQALFDSCRFYNALSMVSWQSFSNATYTHSCTTTVLGIEPAKPDNCNPIGCLWTEPNQ